ncbi:MAG: cpsD [Gemmataceae bacterium]|nr:cpsD [Gemmataceae bacterium]
MFNALSGGSSARPSGGPEPVGTAPWAAGRTSAAATVEPPVVGEGYLTGDAPFVEVGGPGGPVFSAGPAVVKLPPLKTAEGTQPAVAAAVLPADPPAVSRAPAAPAQPAGRTYPRLAGDPTYLSVTFHDLTDRPRTKIGVEGPDPGLVALHFPDHPVSGEYRTLRDEVRTQLPDPTPHVLLFTAAAGAAGTTTVLLNLAVTIAREAGPRVLVVDANLDRPAVAQRFALKKAVPGLAEVLAQQVPLAWAVQPSAVPNLQLLPAGGATAGVAATLSQDLPKLVDQLRQWYDWVLVDGGVWGAIPERDAVCPTADAIYLVTRAADVDRSEFAGLRGWVRELGGLLRGYITTRT